MKKCPYCAEEIQDEAIICRFCGRELNKSPIIPPSATIPIAQPKKKSNPWIFIILGLVVVAVCIIIANVLNNNHGGGSSSSGYKVTYVVDGTSDWGSITYNNAQGGTEQADVQIPFSKTYTMASGDFVYISVQNNKDSGTVTCKILVNDVEVRTSTSSAPYGIADCSGRL